MESSALQRQMDLEVELLERKVRLFVGRAELLEKKDQSMPRDVRDDLTAVQDKWNALVKLVDVARLDEAENERLRRRAAEVGSVDDVSSLIMVALWNRQTIIFSSCGFFLLLLLPSFFIPRLISAVADWTSTILPHMVWPWCEFRMQI